MNIQFFTFLLVASLFLNGCEVVQTVRDNLQNITESILTGKQTTPNVKDTTEAKKDDLPDTPTATESSTSSPHTGNYGQASKIVLELRDFSSRIDSWVESQDSADISESDKQSLQHIQKINSDIKTTSQKCYQYENNRGRDENGNQLSATEIEVELSIALGQLEAAFRLFTGDQSKVAEFIKEINQIKEMTS